MGRTVDIPLVEAFEPLLRSARYKGAYGGRGSSKSHGFADLLIDRCLMHAGTRVVCIREYQVTLEQSVKRLLEDKIETYDLQRTFRVMKSHIETPGDGIVIFQGMQAHNSDSIKSLEGYDIAWVEEAQNLSQRSLDLLRPTIRKDATYTMPQAEMWFSWNPRSPKDPVDQLLRGDVLPPDSIVININWRDNPYFPSVLRREMEYDRRRDLDKYQHVWEGAYETHSSARVFKNWRVEEVVAPDDALFYYGADWGFSIDPTVLVRMWFKDEHTLVVDHEVYKVGCEIDDTPKLFDGILCGCDYESPRPCRKPELHGAAREWQIRADSARPETISYMQKHGYPLMVPATKGPNSVKEGVIFLQSYDIVVHPRCTQTIKELTHYSYVVDPKTEEVTPLLADKVNHVIDPLRYGTELLRAGSYDDWTVVA